MPSILHPSTRTPVSFKGNLAQKLDGTGEFSVTTGSGWFLGPSQGGYVSLSRSETEPPPDWAPASLAGFNVAVTGSLAGDLLLQSVSSTQFGWTSSESGGKRNYQYRKTGLNMARMKITLAGQPVYQTDLQLTFTSETDCEATGYKMTLLDTHPVSYNATILSRSATNAPASFVGQQWHSRNLDTGWETTFDFYTSTRVRSTDGNGTKGGTYTYSRTGNNSASFTMTASGTTATAQWTGIFTSNDTMYVEGTDSHGIAVRELVTRQY
jgi:hypothetical protein